jgi:hypothetical protein
MDSQNKKTKSSSKSQKKKIIMVFPEKLLKSLNKIQKKQNYELLKVLSHDKAIPLDSLHDFLDDQPTISIKSTK